MDASEPERHRTPAAAPSYHRGVAGLHSRSRGAQAELESRDGKPARLWAGEIGARAARTGSGRPSKASIDSHPARRGRERPSSRDGRGRRPGGSCGRATERSSAGAQIHPPPHRVVGRAGRGTQTDRPGAPPGSASRSLSSRPVERIPRPLAPVARSASPSGARVPLSLLQLGEPVGTHTLRENGPPELLFTPSNSEGLCRGDRI